MKGSVIAAIIGIFMLSIAGCSPVKIYSDPGLTKASGLKYYTVKPYLLVERDASNNNIIKATVIYLPDLANPQYLVIKNGMGSRKVDLKLTDGSINTFGLATDPGIPGYIESLAAMVSKSAEAIKDLSGLKGIPQPGASAVTELYEVYMDAQGTSMRKVEF
ncbi:MAG: hypothetical protein ACM3RX_08820 [Methanococcaceae archaeon]